MGDWPNPSIVGSSIANLGAKVDGKTALLRAGSSPYEYIGLIYDATLGKWVSAKEAAAKPASSGNPTTTSTTYALVNTDYTRSVIPNYKDLYNAGLRLQVWLMSDLKNSSGANTSFMALRLNELADGDTAAPTQLGSTFGGEVSIASATATRKFSGWVDFDPGAPSKQHAEFWLMIKVTAGTGTYNNSDFSEAYYRFVG